MKSSERRLKLMLLIQQKGKKRTVNELAEYFQVSRRTIFRDIRALEEINIPVTWDRYTGYGIMPGYKIPPLMFSTEELATIIIGLNFVTSQVDRKMVSDAKAVEIKIKNVLPEELRELMVSLRENTVVDPYQKLKAEKREGGDWYLISSAISQKNRIQFRYVTRDEEKSTRKIDPYILVYFEDHWNVIGFSHLRGEIRNFVLDRMSEIEILPENFTRNPKTSVEALIFRPDASWHEIILEVDKEGARLLEANLPANIISNSKFKPNLFRISFLFDNLDYLNTWLLRYADKVKIIAPQELVEKRTALLKKMLGVPKPPIIETDL